MLIFILWIADVVHGLSAVLFVGGILGGIVRIVLGFSEAEAEAIRRRSKSDGLDERIARKGFLQAFVFGGLCVLTAVLLPSKQTIYMMAGASMVQDLAATPEVTETARKVNTILQGKLDEMIKEMGK